MIVKPPSDDAELEELNNTKIFYCSRTHSQLTQFANEVRRVKIPTSVIEAGAASETSLEEGIKHLTLGSRKNLCINPQVSKRGSAVAISERCLELQQSGTPQEHKCSFLPNKDNETLVNDFRNHTLARIRDIEDLEELGRTIGICPYYASRSTIKASEVGSGIDVHPESKY